MTGPPMTAAGDALPIRTEPAFRRFVRALTFREVGFAIAFGMLGALLLNPIFITPFPIVLGRVVAVALMLLAVFKAVEIWPPPGVPRWLAPVLAIVLAAPFATLIAYLPTVDGRISEMLNEARISGFVSITMVTLLVAPVLAFGALYRQRDAEARAAQLAFALERSQLEKQALDARLKLLHAQIEPHFLFNTLANVQELVESGSTQAGPVLKSLIAYLRAAMPRLHEATPTLDDEVRLVRAYLDLMYMRMPDRLRYAIDVAPALGGIAFPPMGLVTLVENAIRHGIDPSEAGGRIDIGAQTEAGGERLRIVVADTGSALADTAVPGTGLENLRARLRAFYGADATLELHENVPRGVRAELVFRVRPRAVGATA